MSVQPPLERILVRGGTVLTMDPSIGDLVDADVLVEDGRIVAVAPDLQVTDARVVEAAGKVVLPGFVDTHRHTWQSVIRNIGSDWTLGQYFTGIHFGLSRYYRPQDTYIGNLLGVVEALDSGITTLLDWSHNLETPDHSDAAVQGLLDSGARCVFAHGGGASMWAVPSSLPHTRDVLRLKEQYFGSDDQLVTMAFAARGPQFAPGETTLADWALARELGTRITVHVGDGEWGRTGPVRWMHEHGLTGPEVTYVHCNTIADDEMQIIADTGGSASVSADIETQMGHGWPATGRLLDAGVRPSLSIDVCTSNGGNMFNAMKTTISTQRALDNAAVTAADEQVGVRLTCRDVLEFATIEGARATGLDAVTGSLTPGKKADLVVVDTTDLATTPLNNPHGALVYSAHPGLVQTVMVDGRIVKDRGRLVDVDVDRIRRLATETRDHLFEQAARSESIPDARADGTWMPSAASAG
ncbi:MAG: amidohydrolase family protein [Nocardioidaceae bacterium]|nr:amidohydrolase family protein [Nocardioidaceae bacterium]